MKIDNLNTVAEELEFKLGSISTEIYKDMIRLGINIDLDIFNMIVTERISNVIVDTYRKGLVNAKYDYAIYTPIMKCCEICC